MSGRPQLGRSVSCFIPFFNFYWVFVAFYGRSKDYMDFLDRHQLSDAPRVSEGAFLAAAILSTVSILLSFVLRDDSLSAAARRGLVGIASMVVNCIMVFQLCKAVNYFAERSDV